MKSAVKNKELSKNNEGGFAHWLLPLIIILAVVAIGFFVFNTQKSKTDTKTTNNTTDEVQIDVNNPPKFIQASFIDLSKIYSISKFRSAEGHDFSGNGETCRSMKHYFTPQIDPTLKPEKAADGRTIPPQPNGKTDIDIFSPVDGTITDIAEERLPVGEQIYIEPKNAKGYTIRLFHVYKLDGISKGSALKAGQKIGVISANSATDIAVQGGSDKYVSYFQVMPDNLFAEFQKRGATSKDDFIISKEYRDAHPVPCNQDKQGDQSFHYPEGYDYDADDFHLSGYVKPNYTQTH